MSAGFQAAPANCILPLKKCTLPVCCLFFFKDMLQSDHREKTRVVKDLKLTIDRSPEYIEAEINIKCGEIDKTIQDVIDLVQNKQRNLSVQQDGSTKTIPLSAVYYLESVDEKTFVYSKGEVFSTGMKLYEAEEMLSGTSFVRISKSCILNIDTLDSVRVLMNGKMEAALDNGEKLIINRHYVPGFKKKFGL